MRPATRRITGTLEGSTSGRRPLPSCGRKWRSCAQAAAWKVAARIVPGTPSSRSRWRSSPAALSVKVTASTSDGEATSASTWWAMRWVIVRVLPVPAPARMHTGPCSASAAWRWAGLSPASSDALWDDALWREALWGLRDSVAGGDGSMASVTITRTVRRSADTLPGGGDAASPGGRPTAPARTCGITTAGERVGGASYGAGYGDRRHGSITTCHRVPQPPERLPPERIVPERIAAGRAQPRPAPGGGGAAGPGVHPGGGGHRQDPHDHPPHRPPGARGRGLAVGGARRHLHRQGRRGAAPAAAAARGPRPAPRGDLPCGRLGPAPRRPCR